MCGPSGERPPGGGMAAYTSVRPQAVRKTRCGPAATSVAATAEPGANSGCPHAARSTPSTAGSAVRTQTSTVRAPRPRSNRTAPPSPSRPRSGSGSGPSSVITVRAAHRASPAGRQNATAWFQRSCGPAGVS
ncbi:hypothetical protein BJF78_25555 [Pseudonocardia sp. CNS-139]|nr:hypothetical protein BJF78_25555 [Pseudonocardia sp. CNS-139]